MPDQSQYDVRHGRVQSVEDIVQRPVSIQVKVFRKVFAELELEKRRQRSGSHRSAEYIPRLEAWLERVSNHWKLMRQECLANPEFFEWPSTKAWIGSGNFDTSGFSKDGALRLFGYSVSAEFDLSDRDRREILDLVFNVSVPPVTEWYQVAEWGEPGTVQRLKKMANCLASFARNGSRRRDHRMTQPVLKWCRDLEYLKIKYYDGKFGFGWPNTTI